MDDKDISSHCLTKPVHLGAGASLNHLRQKSKKTIKAYQYSEWQSSRTVLYHELHALCVGRFGTEVHRAHTRVSYPYSGGMVDTAVEYVQRDYRTYVSERQELLHSSEFILCQLENQYSLTLKVVLNVNSIQKQAGIGFPKNDSEIVSRLIYPKQGCCLCM